MSVPPFGYLRNFKSDLDVVKRKVRSPQQVVHDFLIVTPINSSEARTAASEASLPPAGARIFRGPVGPLKF